MFEDLLTKKYEVRYLDKKNTYIFEIPNFLSDEQYKSIYENLPNIQENEAVEINEIFHDKSNAHNSKVFVNELNKEKYNKYIVENPVLKELMETFRSPALNNFFLKKFFFQILHSRIHDKKTFIKLLLRKNQSVKNKSESLLNKLFYNQIHTTFELAYMYHSSQAIPHTDGIKKVLSLMLYFPDKELSENQINNLGTTFYKSNNFNLLNDKIQTYEESEKFKGQNSKLLTLPFKKKKLYGFIKSHPSLHSVEPLKIKADFVRKNFNINLLLV